MSEDMFLGIHISYELWVHQHDQKVLIAARFESVQKALDFAEVKNCKCQSVQIVEVKTVRVLKT